MKPTIFINDIIKVPAKKFNSDSSSEVYLSFNYFGPLRKKVFVF